MSTHWLRHTTLTWVERHFGYGIARAYAGHTDSTGPATTYIKAALMRQNGTRGRRARAASQSGSQHGDLGPRVEAALD